MPSGKHKGPRRLVYFGDDLEAALSAHLKATGLKASDVIRDALAGHLGQPGLAGGIVMGRPRKEVAPDPAESAPRKTAKAASGKKVTAPRKSARKSS